MIKLYESQKTIIEHHEEENKVYIDIAKKFNIKYVLGDDYNVLSRLIKCGKIVNATDIFRITSESPFTFLENF